MSIISPKIPKELTKIDDFYFYSKDFLVDEILISMIKSQDERVTNMNFLGIEIQRSIFNKDTFYNCIFENGSFIDIIFKGCDFSNSKFTGCYFERCEFIDCKCVGVNMVDTVIKQVMFKESNFQYSNFDETKIVDVLFERVDFTEGSMSQAKLKRFKVTNSIFIGNNFFKTMLGSVNFTDSEFNMPMVSSPPDELKGVIINPFQASDLIRSFGVIVKR